MRSIEPGILRFRVWSFGPSRNDVEGVCISKLGLSVPHNYSLWLWVAGQARAHGSWYPHRENYVDLDPTYVDAYGQPLLRMTFDLRENERKMSIYLSKKIDEIAKATGADIAPPTAPRKGPYDSRVYQTTHVTGGTIMGRDPDTSVVSPKLQH